MGEQLVALPRVIFAQRVIDKMVQNAMLYGEETGEAMVGLVLPQPAPAEPDIYVLEIKLGYTTKGKTGCSSIVNVAR